VSASSCRWIGSMVWYYFLGSRWRTWTVATKRTFSVWSTESATSKSVQSEPKPGVTRVRLTSSCGTSGSIRYHPDSSLSFEPVVLTWPARSPRSRFARHLRGCTIKPHVMQSLRPIDIEFHRTAWSITNFVYLTAVSSSCQLVASRRSPYFTRSV